MAGGPLIPGGSKMQQRLMSQMGGGETFGR